MSSRWFYHGDRDLACGGLFYSLEGYHEGYVDAVRVTPCSDGGGQDNAWWIEALTLIIPDKADGRRADVLSSCGWSDLDGLTAAQQRHAMVTAVVGYGLYDPANTYPSSPAETVQLGKEPDDCGTYGWRAGRPNAELVAPTVVLPGNASLRRYVLRFIAERF